MFENASILITGGTGSFGNAVLKYLLTENIKEIRIFSRDELKQDDMRRTFRNNKIKFYLGDIRNYESVANAMKGIDYVFNAAALKQVPSCEFFPMEAVMTNVIGTDNVLQAAISANVKKVVCLSTDKAAYPINAMGMSKAMMERVFIAKSRIAENTLICGTRYGNVMCSRGSAIPLFVNQIKAGSPITVTDPAMTRFLMNLDEAVNLVFFAFQNAKPGDLMVQKAPACTVGDLVEALKQLFNADNPVEYIGVRHGEKNCETLLTKEESLHAEDLGGFYRVPADNRTLNYEQFIEDGKTEVSQIDEFNSDNTRRLDVEQIMQALLTTQFIKEALQKNG
ncbi:MAG: polysaccharide biosynthesis protein [Firmicutes bacterium]|nr:polysaccharide biosynthesis protein [Bacillota bacterium]